MLCIYCGAEKECMDHLIQKTGPKGKYASDIVVPACRLCNSILGSSPLVIIEERRWVCEQYYCKFKRSIKSGKHRSIDYTEVCRRLCWMAGSTIKPTLA